MCSRKILLRTSGFAEQFVVVICLKGTRVKIVPSSGYELRQMPTQTIKHITFQVSHFEQLCWRASHHSTRALQRANAPRTIFYQSDGLSVVKWSYRRINVECCGVPCKAAVQPASGLRAVSGERCYARGAPDSQHRTIFLRYSCFSCRHRSYSSTPSVGLSDRPKPRDRDPLKPRLKFWH